MRNNNHICFGIVVNLRLLTAGMEAENKLLSRCSLVLSVSGAHLFAHTKKATIVRWILRALCASAILMRFELLWRLSSTVSTIISISFLTFILLNIASVYLLVRNREKLETLLTALVQGIGEPAIRRLEHFVALVHILFVLQAVLVFAVFLNARHPSSMRLFDVTRYITYYVGVSVSNWIITTALFYWIMMQILFAYQKQQMLKLKHGLSLKKVDGRMLRSTMIDVRKSSDAFEEILSFLPFLWFLYGMINSSASIYRLIRSPSIMMITYIIRDYIPPLLVVVAVDRAVTKFAAITDQVIDSLAHNTQIELKDRLHLLHDLDSIRAKRLTGLAFFTLEKSFLVSYVGSVLTFAALIAGFRNE